MANTTFETLCKGKKRSVPFFYVISPDQRAAIVELRDYLMAEENYGSHLMVQWDMARAFIGLDEKGREWVKQTKSKYGKAYDKAMLEPHLALSELEELPDESTAFFINADHYIKIPIVMTVLGNLRDKLKGGHNMVVLFSTENKVPPQLSNDVIVLNEEYPDDVEIRQCIQTLCDKNFPIINDSLPKNAKKMAVTEETVKKASVITRALPRFTIEQLISLSIGQEHGIELDQLWGLKREALKSVRGLSYNESKDTLDDLGGISNAKELLHMVMKGRFAPQLLVYTDELDRHLGGAQSGGHNDNTGTSQSVLATILDEMEKHEDSGAIFVGHPGTAKTAISKAIANTYDIPCIIMDISGNKQKELGASEENIRKQMATIRALGGKNVFFIGSCNSVQDIPPALRRRYDVGVVFFDLPSREELLSIWLINLKKYEFLPKSATIVDVPGVVGNLLETQYTGAEVRNICRMAYRCNTTLEHSAQFIIPMIVSDPEGIDSLRRVAHNRWLSASYPGKYVYVEAGENNSTGKIEKEVKGRAVKL